jgi:hypothetical protein
MAAKRDHRLLHDVETQPRTFRAAHVGVRAEESLEQLVTQLFRHTQAIVTHLHDELLACTIGQLLYRR